MRRALVFNPASDSLNFELIELATADSRLGAWAMPVEEGMQIAYVCARVASEAF